MDFIERFFGFSPDYDDKSFELLLLIVLVAIISVAAWRFFHHLRD